MNHSFLVALKDSSSSRVVLDYLTQLPLCADDITITLLHVFQKPSTSEEFMGEGHIQKEMSRIQKDLEDAKERLIRSGFNGDAIQIRLVTEELYPTVTEGILEQFNQGNFDLVVIGRRKKSKSEEFVMGDVSVKLVRSFEGATGVLVVKFD